MAIFTEIGSEDVSIELYRDVALSDSHSTLPSIFRLWPNVFGQNVTLG